MIPLFYPPNQNIDRMIEELRDTLSGQRWECGGKVSLFEKRFGEKFGFKYCVMTNSYISALHLAYILAGIGLRKQVGVPVLTNPAICHPLKMMGTYIRFIDIKKNTLTLDPDDLRLHADCLVAVVHSHLGGVVAYHQKIRKIADYYGLKIIEDASQALGAKKVGYGDYIVFSFQAIGALSTGDGGMLVVKTEEDYQRAKRLRWFSIDKEKNLKKNWRTWNQWGMTSDQKEVGYGYQPTDIDASIGLVGLDDFDRNQRHRHHLAQLYRSLLKDCKTVSLLDTEGSSDWLFTVLVNMDRDKFASILFREGIETDLVHVQVDRLTVFGGKAIQRTGFNFLKNMNEIENKYLCLPLNNRVTEDGVKYICNVIKSIKP